MINFNLILLIVVGTYMHKIKVDILQFTRSVQEIVSAVPSGKVTTYGDVAALAGFPSHARLVGKILGCIGMDSDIPCHRVVNAQGRPAPHWLNQADLLRREGVAIGNSGRVDMSKYRWQPLSAE